MSIFLTLIGGFGIGTIVTTIVQHFLKRKSYKDDRIYQERKEVFIGILQTIEDLQNNFSKEKSSRLGYWIARSKLVATNSVNKELAILVQTKAVSQERDTSMENLLLLMKKDLGLN